MMDDLSNFVGLEPTESCTAATRSELYGGILCDSGKGTAAELIAEIDEHVDRSVTSCNGG